MNDDEKIVQDFLLKLNLGQIKYEPDGNVPPDFTINSEIGIEARRLNQNYFTESKIAGIEQKYFSLANVLKQTLTKFDNEFQGKSYFVSLIYKRPVEPSLRVFRSRVKQLIRLMIDSGKEIEGQTLPIGRNIKLEIIGRKTTKSQFFRIAGAIDFGTGDFTVANLVNNINYCVEEKSRKIKPYKLSYSEWWLLLVNHIGWNLDQQERELLAKKIDDLGVFKKVFILDRKGKELQNFIL